MKLQNILEYCPTQDSTIVGRNNDQSTEATFVGSAAEIEIICIVHREQVVYGGSLDLGSAIGRTEEILRIILVSHPL